MRDKIKPVIAIKFSAIQAEMQDIIADHLSRGYELHTFDIKGNIYYALMINYFRQDTRQKGKKDRDEYIKANMDNKSARQIAKELGVSNSTVSRKITEFTIGRVVI